MEYKQVHIPEEPANVKSGKDVAILAAAFLGALKLLLAAPPFEWELPQETVDAIVNMVAVLVTLYGVWKNTYTTKKSQQQKYVLQQTGLKEKE